MAVKEVKESVVEYDDSMLATFQDHSAKPFKKSTTARKSSTPRTPKTMDVGSDEESFNGNLSRHGTDLNCKSMATLHALLSVLRYLTLYFCQCKTSLRLNWTLSC